MKISISPYDPNWPADFLEESRLLYQSIPNDKLKIEHIGSTSIPHLDSKPIIDIMIGLENFEFAADYIESIINLGYEYHSEYENTMPDRKFFTKQKAGVKTHHIHMVEFDSFFWNRHLLFRDYLRNNKNARDDYSSIKQVLAKKEWTNENEYAQAKNSFIRKIELTAVNNK